jgi:hypothetical protein
MKLTRFTLRDLFWLLLVCSFAAGWWAELRARREADRRYQGARKMVEQTAELLHAATVEVDGEIVGIQGINLVTCPTCAETMYVSGKVERVKTEGEGGKPTYHWRQTGKCRACKGRFGYVLMPEDCPGYMTWLPIFGSP